MSNQSTVRDVLMALDKITGGRVVTDSTDFFNGRNRFVVIKSSNIPGKAVTETPGLVFGNPDQEVKKLAVTMTLTESNIELAGALGIDAIVCHHPIADASNSGGVTLKDYLGLYNIAVFEVHEAFHGLHPGLSYLHGHAAFHVDIAYGGVPGNIMFVGKALDEVNTLGDMLNRLAEFMAVETEKKMLDMEREIRDCTEIHETSVSANGMIIIGDKEDSVNTILHIFPHTGFTPEHLEQALREFPEIDTVLASISRVRENSPFVEKCRELGLKLIVGNSHAMEIFENGLPLGMSLDRLLPDVEVMMFRERVCSTPIKKFGSAKIQEYASMIADKYLLNKNKI